MSARAEFSFDRPFTVSAGELVFGGKRYRQGAKFPARELGVSREGLWELWQANKVDCVAPAPATSKPAAAARK